VFITELHNNPFLSFVEFLAQSLYCNKKNSKTKFLPNIWKNLYKQSVPQTGLSFLTNTFTDYFAEGLCNSYANGVGAAITYKNWTKCEH
jgi:hypothetical protein